MMKMPTIICLVAVWAGPATAGVLTHDDVRPNLAREDVDRGARDFFIQDSSFEDGTCSTGNSAWTCETSNSCDWIADLVPHDLWNYDGNHVAWLGGFCDLDDYVATDYTHICQTVDLQVSCGIGLEWFWMAYVNEGGTVVSVTIDGEVVYSKTLTLADHLLDYQNEMLWINGWWGSDREICFNYDRNDAHGDNYFVDMVGIVLGITPVEETSFSTVKSMY